MELFNHWAFFFFGQIWHDGDFTLHQKEKTGSPKSYDISRRFYVGFRGLKAKLKQQKQKSPMYS